MPCVFYSTEAIKTVCFQSVNQIQQLFKPAKAGFQSIIFVGYHHDEKHNKLFSMLLFKKPIRKCFKIISFRLLSNRLLTIPSCKFRGNTNLAGFYPGNFA